MNTSKAILLGAVLFAAAGTLLRAQTPVRVTANSVNLRAKPQPTAEVVAQANYDDRLLAREIGEEWVEVAAPPAVDLWVLKAYVKQPENTIGAQRVNLRAGPSINYNIVDTLSLGDAVEPRGEEAQDWLKVAPPASAHVWISREYVEIVSGAASAAAGGEKSAKADRKPRESSNRNSRGSRNSSSKNAETEANTSTTSKRRKTSRNAAAKVAQSRPPKSRKGSRSAQGVSASSNSAGGAAKTTSKAAKRNSRKKPSKANRSSSKKG